MGQTLPFVRAVFGAMRSFLGYRLLKRHYNKLSPGYLDQEIGRNLWQYSQRIRWLLQGRAMHANRFGHGWQYHLLAKLHKYNPEFPVVSACFETVGSKEALRAKNLPSPIIICVHTKLLFSIATALRQIGRECAVVKRAGKKTGAKIIGTDGFDSVIDADANAFVKTRKSLKSGHPVVAMLDFTRRRKGTLFHDHFFNTALIKFAKRASIPIVFVIPKIKQDGKIEVLFTQYEQQEHASDDEIAEQFRTFVMSNTQLDARWTLVSSPQDVLHLNWQLKDFCIQA